MCGIAGYINKDRRPADPEILVGMAAIQHHRGPDGYGWDAFDECGVGFSHARLSIIDLHDSGRQPFRTHDGNLLLAHNGEFYEYQKIRAMLTAKGARFRTKSDSEIVLHLYERYGLEKTLEHLRGEFAFSLYDRKEDRLILVRDRFGIKPLYWTDTGSSIVFGSEIKVLFAHPEVSRKFSDEGLYHQLMQTMVPGTTPYENIHQVKPGFALIITRENGSFKIKERQYWDVDFPLENEYNDRGEDHFIEDIREGLLDAVQTRLVADVPVGCYLSGGIDSCSIIGLASATRQDHVKAFTIGFDNDEYDESHIAKEMADSVGADQHLMKLNSDDLYGNFVQTHWHTERTVYNTLAVAKFLMSKRVKESGYKVVVTGEGSDELFAGYPGFRRDMFLHGSSSHMKDSERSRHEGDLQESNALVKGAMLAEEEINDPYFNEKIGFTPSSLQPWLSASSRVPGILSPGIREKLKSYKPGQAIASQLNGEKMKGRHPLDIAQYVWIKTMLEGQILTWGGDRVDMANSMEARPAFLDHHFAARAFQVPPHYRIKGNVEKYVLREAMKGILPKVLYEREKFAFMAPPAHKDEVRYRAMLNLAEDYLSDGSIQSAGLMDIAGVREIFRIHDAPDTPASTLVQLDAVINHMLGVQILQRNLLDENIPTMAKAKAASYGWNVSGGCSNPFK